MVYKKILSLILITTIILFLTLFFKDPELKQVESMRLSSFNGDTVLSEMVILVKNPNFYNLKLKGLSLSVFVNDTLLGVGTSDKQDVVLRRRELTPVSIKFKFDISSFLKQLDKQQENKNEIPVKTVIQGKLPYLGLAVSYTLNQKIDIDSFVNKIVVKNIVSVKIKKVEISEINVNISKLRIVVTVKNNLPINVNVKRIDTKVYNNKLKSVLLGKSQTLYDFSIIHGVIKELILETEINNFTSTITIFKKFLNNDQLLHIQGNITIDLSGETFIIPFESVIQIKV